MHRGMSRTRRWLTAGLVAAACAVTVAGCAWFGGGRGGGDRTPQTDRNEVRLGDFYFEPAELEVRSGQEVTLRLRNVGSTVHNFRIEEFQVDQDVEAGRDETVTFTPDQAGTFRIICDIPGHVEAGMVGTLRVSP
ncbi:MAG TPA: cupredoxin domain-containing protein [Bacillota bacterium]